VSYLGDRMKEVERAEVELDGVPISPILAPRITLLTTR